MKISAAVLLMFCLALTGCLKGPGKGPWANATGAEQFEKLMWQSIRDQKWNEVENHLASTFVGVSSNGQKFDRAGWVEHWKQHPAGEISLGELSVQPDGSDMVVSYEAHWSGGGSNPPGLQVLSVWQQLKHGWVLISQSLTPMRTQ